VPPPPSAGLDQNHRNRAKGPLYGEVRWIPQR
jgi:hypothetical protein